MTAQILDGKAIAAIWRAEIKQQVAQQAFTPALAVIQVGAEAASTIYIKHKQKAAHEVGIQSSLHSLPSDCDTAQLLKLIQQLNHDPAIHGILVQLPLPNQIDATAVLEQIDPAKDVDGFHPYNLGRLAQRHPLLRPCTPLGIMRLLNYQSKPLKGLHAVIVGASNIVGRPMALELLMAACTVTICHSATQNLAQHIQQADLLVAAVGKPGLIESQWIKANAIVIDVAINRLSDKCIVGDIDFETALPRAAWITPVPGGVGPMTVAALLHNTLQAAQLQTKATNS